MVGDSRRVGVLAVHPENTCITASFANASGGQYFRVGRFHRCVSHARPGFGRRLRRGPDDGEPESLAYPMDV